MTFCMKFESFRNQSRTGIVFITKYTYRKIPLFCFLYKLFFIANIQCVHVFNVYVYIQNNRILSDYDDC